MDEGESLSSSADGSSPFLITALQGGGVVHHPGDGQNGEIDRAEHQAKPETDGREGTRSSFLMRVRV